MQTSAARWTGVPLEVCLRTGGGTGNACADQGAHDQHNPSVPITKPIQQCFVTMCASRKLLVFQSGVTPVGEAAR